MIYIAIMGFGIVGSGVAEILEENGKYIEEKLGEPIQIKYILDVRDFPDSPFSQKVIHDFSQIEMDPEIQIVVETIGGVGAAKEYTELALRAGKSVVTSNKELVAKFGYELMRLAKEHSVSYLYEASVGGGTPILHPLKQCLAANKITEIYGILNGTTNYILTQMSHAGLSLETALHEAQFNGYAEADPTADLEGQDACRKICILASLAFGQAIDPSCVFVEGITKITASDVAFAKSHGYNIKLLGRATLSFDNNVRIFVSPHLVRDNTPLGLVDDVFNAVVVHGNAVGKVLFYGRGAGKRATASAVISDVMEAVRTKSEPKQLDWGAGSINMILPAEEAVSRWYVRAECEEKMLSEVLGKIEVLTCNDQKEETAVLTEPMTAIELKQRLAGQQVLAYFRVLDD